MDNIDLENLIANLIDEIEWIEINPKYYYIYSDVEDENLKIIFSKLHNLITEKFKLMNSRLPTKNNESHFWAEDSRILIDCIEKIDRLYYGLKDSSFPIEIDSYYKELIKQCELFLSSSGGSTIPKGMEKITIYSKKKIFHFIDTIELKHKNTINRASLKYIGEGSYAKVLKYKDPIYNINFAIKRAKKKLSEKELKRFKNEYESLITLDSPYIIKVYSYDSLKNEYIMECMDTNLKNYINRNNNKLDISNRKKIIFQFLKGYEYIHSKKMLHRDISPKNILIKEHDDKTTIVKISDFGLVKTINSNLTSLDTHFKGSYNDPSLLHSFNEYKLVYEIYALTYLIYFVITGKERLRETGNKIFDEFVLKGTDIDITRRFQNISELKEEFIKLQL